MSYPITSFFVLYFIGLAILLLSDSVGLGLFRFRKNNIFFGLFLEFLLLIATYGFAQARFNSVDIFMIVWILTTFIWLKTRKGNIQRKGIINLQICEALEGTSERIAKILSPFHD